MKSRFISPRPARLGLLYVFIVGGQCHTRPLMHVAGVLGCCTPVGNTSLYCNGAHRGKFNIKVSSCQYRKFHCRDNTILPPSHLLNRIYLPILVRLHLHIGSGPRTFLVTQQFCCICTEIIQGRHINTDATSGAVFPHTARLAIAVM